jgi:hypothetical protein
MSIYWASGVNHLFFIVLPKARAGALLFNQSILQLVEPKSASRHTGKHVDLGFQKAVRAQGSLIHPSTPHQVLLIKVGLDQVELATLNAAKKATRRKGIEGLHDMNKLVPQQHSQTACLISWTCRTVEAECSTSANMRCTKSVESCSVLKKGSSREFTSLSCILRDVHEIRVYLNENADVGVYGDALPKTIEPSSSGKNLASWLCSICGALQTAGRTSKGR